MAGLKSAGGLIPACTFGCAQDRIACPSHAPLARRAAGGGGDRPRNSPRPPPALWGPSHGTAPRRAAGDRSVWRTCRGRRQMLEQRGAQQLLKTHAEWRSPVGDGAGRSVGDDAAIGHGGRRQGHEVQVPEASFNPRHMAACGRGLAHIHEACWQVGGGVVARRRRPEMDRGHLVAMERACRSLPHGAHGTSTAIQWRAMCGGGGPSKRSAVSEQTRTDNASAEGTGPSASDVGTTRCSKLCWMPAARCHGRRLLRTGRARRL